MFSSSDEVHDVSISWNYILLSVTYNFGPGEWAKIERNDSKPLCPKTLLVDWGVYVQWAQRVSKTICQNRIGFSYIFYWSCQVWQLTPPFFPNVSTFEKRLHKDCDDSVCWCFLRRKASVDHIQTLLPVASFIPPPCRLNNEQQCYLFYSVTWLKQTLTIFSKISLKLSFILASLKLLHNPLRNFAKNCIKCAKKQEYFDSLNNILTITWLKNN